MYLTQDYLFDEDGGGHRVGVGHAPAGEQFHGHGLHLVLGGRPGEVGGHQRAGGLAHSSPAAVGAATVHSLEIGNGG